MGRRAGCRWLGPGLLVGLGEVGSGVGEQVAVVGGSLLGLGGPVRPLVPLLELGRLLVGANRLLQGRHLLPARLDRPSWVPRGRPPGWLAGLGGSFLELLGPLLEPLGVFDRLLDLLSSPTPHGAGEY